MVVTIVCLLCTCMSIFTWCIICKLSLCFATISLPTSEEHTTCSLGLGRLCTYITGRPSSSSAWDSASRRYCRSTRRFLINRGTNPEGRHAFIPLSAVHKW
ncbi:hypothetical protein F4861DRAFT_467402 [Xylaria intraflava]|nr:hypothetical protein F4861DRAFT_467402 [Xylaria intraflava]